MDKDSDLGMSQEETRNLWFAFVKYKTGEKEIVPVIHIKEKTVCGKKLPFHPQTLNDFNAQSWYIVRTTHGRTDGKYSKWYAHIGLLAG